MDELFLAQLRKLEDLYIGHRDKYVLCFPDGRIAFKRGRLSNKVMCGHLNRHWSVGVFADESSSKFMTFDVDDGSARTVGVVIEGLCAYGIDYDRIYVSSSGRKGYHVEVFFEEAMKTEDLRALYDAVCLSMGLDKHKVEFRPTFTQSIKLPLSIHAKTGKVCVFVQKMTLIPIEDSGYILQIKKTSSSEIGRAVELARGMLARASEEEANGDCHEDDEEEGDEEANEEVCAYVGAYPELKAKGARHELMVKIAVINRGLGEGKERCREELVRWYRDQNPALISSSEEEVLEDIERIVRWCYAQTFRPGKRKSAPEQICFTASDMESLLRQSSASCRKLLFLVLRGGKKYGCMKATQEELAEALGVKRLSVIEAAKKLSEGGWIRIVKAKAKRGTDGVIRRASSRYYALEQDREPSGAALLCKEVTLPTSEGRSWEDDYYQVLTTLCDERTLGSHLKPREMKALMAREEKKYDQGTETGAVRCANGLRGRRCARIRRGRGQRALPQSFANLCR